MTETNLAQEQEEYRRYLADTYGDDVLVGLATDQPQDPARSSATVHATRRRENDIYAHQDQQLAEVMRAAQERNEDAALDRAAAMIDAGKTPDTRTTVLAARAARRHGGSGVPSAERLAAPSVRRYRREQDDQARREGRRPQG